MGYLHNDVKDLQRLLEDYADSGNGEVILKEIIQNADDAGADKVIILFEPNSPFLQTPAIWFINNGKFNKEKDDIAIMSMSDSSKSEGAIGKFGIGMKSIHGIAEVLILQYYEQKERTWSATQNIRDDKRLFPKFELWSQALENDIIQQSDYYKKIVNADTSTKFVITAFLRTKEQFQQTGLTENTWNPVKEVWFDNCTAEDVLPVLYRDNIPLLQDIRLCLPLMSTLKLIRTFDKNSFELSNNSITSQWKEITEISYNQILKGELLRKANEKTQHQSTIFYIGKEYITNDNNEKKHGAAIIYYKESDSSTLDIIKSVYLPLTPRREDIDTVQIKYTHSDNYAFVLNLHGNFIPNSGRNTIEIDIASANNKRNATWNREIWDNHTLPAVLPTFIELCRDRKISKELFKNLIVAFVSSKTWKENRDIICKNENLLLCFTENGNTEWKLVPCKKDIIELQDDLYTTLKSNFPVLNEVTQDKEIIPSSAKNCALLNTSSNIRKFNIAEIQELFADSITVEQFKTIWNLLNGNYKEQDLPTNLPLTLLKDVLNKEVKMSLAELENNVFVIEKNDQTDIIVKCFPDKKFYYYEAGYTPKTCGTVCLLQHIKNNPGNITDDKNVRDKFLRDFLSQLDIQADTLFIRYVLHGNKEQFELEKLTNVVQPLYKKGNNDNYISNIFTQIRTLKNDSWVIIPQILAQNINEAQARLIKLTTIDNIVAILKEEDETTLSQLSFNDLLQNERDAILQKIQQENVNWIGKIIKIFRNVYTNELAAIKRNDEKQTFWKQEHIDLPENLQDKFIVLKRPETRGSGEEFLNSALNEEKLLDILLKEENPSQYCDLIIKHLPDKSKEILLATLREKPWIKGGIAPKDVIYLPAITKPNTVTNWYIDVEKNLNISEQKINILRTLYPSVEESFTLIFQQQDSSASIAIKLKPEHIPDIVKCFNSLQTYTVTLIKAVHKISNHEVAKEYEEKLCIAYNNKFNFSPNRDEIIPFLEIINKAESLDDYINLLSAYLDTLGKTDSNNFIDTLNDKNIKLPNAKGEWSPINKLVEWNENIEDNFVINEKLKNVVGNRIPQASKEQNAQNDKQNRNINLPKTREEVEKQYKASKDIWSNYLQELLERFSIPYPEILGTLSVMLGAGDINNPWAFDIAKQYLDKFTIEDIISYLAKGANPIEGEKFEDSIKKQHSLLEVIPINNGDFTTRNLLGQEIVVKLKENPNDLIPEKRDYTYGIYDARWYKIPLIPINAIPKDINITEVIQKTVKKLAEPYKLNFEETWKILTEAEQVDIRSAQSIIEKNLFTDLRYLRLTNCQEFDVLNNEYSKFEREKAKKELSHTETTHIEDNNVEKEFKQKYKDFVIQHKQTIVQAIQKRITDQGYTHFSVPFELFQNADDALYQLVQHGYEPTEKEQAFSVSLNEDKGEVCFTYWGRAINQYKIGENTIEEYQDDLLNIIRMHSSTKKLESNTGKFGLGFKSVYTLTSEPVVISGRISFKIIGGMYPETYHSPSTQYDKHTVIKLPLDKQGLKNTKELFNSNSEFIKVAPYLTILSKAIKKISLLGRDIPSIEDFSVKTSKGSVIFQRNGEQIEPIVEEIPTIWCTTPTRHKLNLGFIVNSTFFPIDAGRSNISLARIDEFQDIVQTINAEMWDKCEKTFNNYSTLFWESLYKVLFKFRNSQYTDDNPLPKSLQQFLVKSSEFTKFFYNKEIFFTELPKCYGINTSLMKIKYYIGETLIDTLGNLDGELRFTTILEHWKSLSQYEIGTIVKHTFPYILDKEDIKTIQISDLLKEEINDDYRITPERAIILGKILTQGYLDKLNEKHLDELNKIREHAKQMWFKNKQNEWQNIKKLLVDKSSDEEGLLAKIAPIEHLLHEDYFNKKESESLFFTMHKHIDGYLFNDDEIIDWIFDPSNNNDKEKQRHIINYIKNPDRNIAPLIKQKIDNNEYTFLRSLPQEQQFELKILSTQATKQLFAQRQKEKEIEPDTEQERIDIGKKGEEYLLKMLKQEFPEPNYEVKWSNEHHESNKSFDFEIFQNGERIHYIECKSSRSTNRTFYLSKEEWEFYLGRRGKYGQGKYLLYRVFNVDKEPSYVRVNDILNSIEKKDIYPCLLKNDEVEKETIFLTFAADHAQRKENKIL